MTARAILLAGRSTDIFIYALPQACSPPRRRHVLSSLAPNCSRIVLAHIRRAALGAATPYRTFRLESPNPRNVNLGTNLSTSSPARTPRLTYSLAFANANANDCEVDAPA